MKSLHAHIKKIFSRKLTVMLVPHHAFKPLHLQFSYSFAIFLAFFWTGITSWATWAVFSNIDYWSMRTNHEILKLKVSYFAREMRKSREVLDQVREADAQLRQLLGMKTRQSIVEGGEEAKGQGGPEGFERDLLRKTLSKKLAEITNSEIHDEADAILQESQQRLQSFNEIMERIAYERELYRCTPRGWPALGRITSHFGMRVSPFTGHPQFHPGIDIANEHGTPVLATADGTVQLADWEGGYGRLVIVDHGFGFLTYYGHNSNIVVKVGQKVHRGQLLAYMGSSGSSTGDHSHYEVWHNGRCLNPWKYIIGNLQHGELAQVQAQGQVEAAPQQEAGSQD